MQDPSAGKLDKMQTVDDEPNLQHSSATWLSCLLSLAPMQMLKEGSLSCIKFIPSEVYLRSVLPISLMSLKSKR